MKNLILITTCINITLSAFANEAVEALGERLFNDIRFSQGFYEASAGDVNAEISQLQLDPSRLNSCSSCHMVDQAFDIPNLGMRGYNDFAIHSPIPLRNDQQKVTLRNTPSLVGIGSKYAQNRFSHWDGEFADHSETVLGNFAGRNMGWLKNEYAQALQNIVEIIKKDNGEGDLAQEFGGAYEKIFLGVDPSIPVGFRLPKEERLDVLSANNEIVIEKVVYFVSAYLNSLDFETDEEGLYSGSPYDEFLKLNQIPREPTASQTIVQYNSELINTFINLKNPKFVKPKEFSNHQGKLFGFEEEEWKGLQIFFNIGQNKSFVRGMCVNCHMAPLFTDQLSHNIGITQVGYEKIHGQGSFKNFKAPNLEERKNQYFLDHPTLKDRKKVDLGAWNFFARVDKPEFTKFVHDSFCPNQECDHKEILPLLIGRFKTPSIRNLGHSNPYFHDGSAKNIKETLEHYLLVNQMTQTNEMVNAPMQIRRMNFSREHFESLEAFLNALNENYE